MSIVTNKLWALAPNCRNRKAHGLICSFTHGESFAMEAVHHGLSFQHGALSSALQATAAAILAGALAILARAAGSKAQSSKAAPCPFGLPSGSRWGGTGLAAGGASAVAVVFTGVLLQLGLSIQLVLAVVVFLALVAWLVVGGGRATLAPVLAAMATAMAAGWVLAAAGCDTARLLFSSLPRTTRTAVWAVRTALAYKRFAMARLGEDPDSEDYQSALGVLHQHYATQLLKLCRANGGVYIKAGQMAAAFGAVPREFRITLSELEDRATPRPYKAVQKVLLQELGPRYKVVFSEFGEQAIAAASMAQVHMARLATGEAVAVKVQYPGLALRVAADLVVMNAFNQVARVLFPAFKLAWLVDELNKKMSEELDFRTEIRNAVRVSSLLDRNQPIAAVPHMYEALSTPRLLVMEWVEGCKVTDKEYMKARQISPRAVGLKLIKLFAELTFVQGFMHADPHAGNVMVRATGRSSFWSWLVRGSRQPFELVLLDHGTYLELSPELRELFCQLWCSFVLQDSALQADMSTAVAGERGPVVLPVLLTQTAASRTEERAVQKAAGISGVGDMASLLQAAPRPVVELLRINTVIRTICVKLGLSMGERRRILTWYARTGLPVVGDHARHVHARFNQRLCRVQLLMLMLGWQGAAAGKGLLSRAWSLIMAASCGLWADVL